MVSPPSTRTDAYDLMERPSERRLIRKARLVGNIGEGFTRLYQELLGTLNPALHQPSVGSHAEACLE